ncbi:MAG: sigma-54-dependent Fis family transcriptional regulator [Myxococcales bacterium]|nr:sigma-54-dependent Fis family transcriptional regulator [Myxococcales bacterium]MCB9707519.1 sigma-54-dependent Fis family transcriptional regulator [Myxococcales bacterium]
MRAGRVAGVSSETKQILLADDEVNLRRVVSAQLTRNGYDVHAVENGQAAIDTLREHHVDVVVTDLQMPLVDGMTLLRHVTQNYPGIPVIMITAHGSVDSAVEALKLGAFDYVTKPFDKEEFRHVIAKAARTSDLAQRDLVERDYLSVTGKGPLVGRAQVMRDLHQMIERVADTPSTVLITGESGTGKELVARTLHELGGRKDKPFIGVHCAAIPSELIESELFGYEKGAFTGAVTSKPGRFELANGGTLFLDEIGEIPLSIQVKLLRALQESEFERVGGIKTIKVDVRLVTATNRELEGEIQAGRFREDLYYRLNVVQIRLPSLRERLEDIPLFVQHFIAKFNLRLGKSIEGIEPEALEVLLAHSWRGNIRELENVMERCVLFCDGTHITKGDIPLEVTGPQDGTPDLGARASSSSQTQTPLPTQEAGIVPEGGLKEAVREATLQLERNIILRALDQTHQNITLAARLLKISRKSLQLKMKELALRNDNRPRE